MINLEACSTLYPSYRYYKRVKLFETSTKIIQTRRIYSSQRNSWSGLWISLLFQMILITFGTPSTSNTNKARPLCLMYNLRMQYDKSPKCTRSPWETVMKSVKTNINENDVVVALQNMKNDKGSKHRWNCYRKHHRSRYLTYPYIEIN